MKLKLFAALIFASACFAQRWELGGTAGYGAYHNGSAIAPGGTATVGMRNRFAVGFVAGENMYQHIGGEFRYLFQDGDPFVQSGSAKGNIQGQSHSFHYNMLFHLYDRDKRLRPYASVGVGTKYYVTTGSAPVPQPFPRIVLLAPVNQTVVLGAVGGGLKYRLGRHTIVRGEFLDYITPMPSHLFIPAKDGTVRGILHQFTPMAGVSWAF